METSGKLRLTEAENVSKLWIVLHIIFLSCAALFGLSAGIVLSLLYTDSEFVCGLPTFNTFSEHEEQLLGNGTAPLIRIVFSGPQANDACVFTQYTMITSFIFGTIWVVFFLICGPGGKSENGLSLPQPWRIVLPAFVFTFIFFFISMGAGIQMTTSLHQFCSRFDAALTAHLNVTTTESCFNLDYYFKISSHESFSVKTLLTIGEIDVWLCTGAWAISAAVCLLRMFLGPDFQRPALLQTGAAQSGNKRNGYEELSSSQTSLTTQTPVPDRAVPSTSRAVVHHPPVLAPQTQALPASLRTGVTSSGRNGDGYEEMSTSQTSLNIQEHEPDVASTSRAIVHEPPALVNKENPQSSVQALVEAPTGESSA